MNPYSSMAIQACLIAALLGLGRTGSAAEPAGHAHGEAGHLPPQAAAPADAYVDSEPPLWENLGALSYPITTRQARAQRYFDQGLKLAYAFNHLEARRAFRMAEKLDPECALCLWGEALVLGPNINAPMDGSAVGPAWARSANEGTGQARERQGKGADRGAFQALCQSAQDRPESVGPGLRRGNGKASRALPRGRRHRRAVRGKPDGPLALGLLAGRRPNAQGPHRRHAEGPGTVLAQHPDHPGAIHYYIHMVEASDRPERAEPYAERLAALAPGAGHLVHMPGHLYYRLGRYRDALEANRAAIAVDEAYLKETGAAGFYAQAYYPHNVHFLLASAQMAGTATPRWRRPTSSPG